MASVARLGAGLVGYPRIRASAQPRGRVVALAAAAALAIAIVLVLVGVAPGSSPPSSSPPPKTDELHGSSSSTTTTTIGSSLSPPTPIKPLPSATSDSATASDSITTIPLFTTRLADTCVTRAVPKAHLIDAIQSRSSWATSMSPLVWMDATKNAMMEKNYTHPPRDLKWFRRDKRKLGTIGAIEYGWHARWSYEGDDDGRYAMMGPPDLLKCEMDQFTNGYEAKRFCKDDCMEKPTGCVVYSIGSQNKWDFERDVHARTKCRIHTFDCTVRGSIPPEIADRTFFYKVCLSNRDFYIGSRRFTDFEGLVKLTGGERPTYLKMDIEGFEWDVLPSLIERANQLYDETGDETVFPPQIAIEMHTTTGFMLPWFGRDKSAGELFALFNHLWFEGGYLTVSRASNPECRFCQEILMVKLHNRGKPYRAFSSSASKKGTATTSKT